MSDEAQDYKIAAIRQLLLAAFTPVDLRSFCYDHPSFRPVVSRFSPDHGLDDMVDALITYCDTRLLFGELLTQVRQANPGQYARFAPYYPGEPESPAATAPAEPAPEKASVAGSPVSLGARPRRDWLIIASSIAAILALIVAVLAWIAPFGDVGPTPEPSQPTLTPSPPAPMAGDTWTRPADDAVMVGVPAGEFPMGSDPGDEWWRGLQHDVDVDAFWIDKYEVTNAQYRQCVEAGACRKPDCWDDSDLNAPDQPVVCVSWQDAQGYADWVGGRLPTEAEWEKAARGTDSRIYPWGDEPPDCDKANFSGCAVKPLPVRTQPNGASPYGALDMAGNVWEWVADWYDAEYYSSQSEWRNPPGPESGDKRVLRGGAFVNNETDIRSDFRNGVQPGLANREIGFRVVVALGP